MDLANSKEKEESVGRDHAGSSLGDQDTKLEADNQWSGAGVEQSASQIHATTLTTLLEALENVQRFRPLAQIGLDD